MRLTDPESDDYSWVEMGTVTPLTHTHHHAVQFYGTDKSLFVTVAGFLSEGLIADQPAIIIATAPHRQAILQHLCDRLIDCEHAIRNGDLVVLDADDTLALFMVGEEPSAALFERNVGRLIEQILGGRTNTVVRAYGEMVDVLWKQGRTEAAIKLEILWNKLALKYGFALLCGYAMGNFYKQSKLMDRVIEQHSHTLPHDSHVVPFRRKRARKTA